MDRWAAQCLSSALRIANLVNYAPAFLRALDGAQLMSERTENYQGKSARMLELSLVERAPDDEHVSMKESKHTAQVWLGPDNLPLATTLTHKRKAKVMVFPSFEQQTKEDFVFGVTANRLVVLEREEQGTAKGIGNDAQYRNTYSFTPKARSSDGHVQAHVDVVLRRVRIGADDVRLVDQCTQLLLIHARAVDGQVHFDAETGRDLANAHFAGHRQVFGQLDFLLAGDELERAQEAGGIAGGKQLLGVGAVTAGAAEFLRGRQLHVQDAIRGARGAFAATLRSCFCAVKNFFNAHD
jgi:hypothetical protein